MFDRFTTKRKNFVRKTNKQIEKIYHITIEYLKIKFDSPNKWCYVKTA